MDNERAETCDTAGRLAIELVLSSDWEAAVAEVLTAGDPAALLQQITRDSLRHRTTLALSQRLAAAGVDLGAVRIDWDGLRHGTLERLIPNLRAGGVTDLAALRAVLLEHQELLREIVFSIGERFPHTYMVGFGLGIDLVATDGFCRESSDIDLFAGSVASADALAEWLVAEWGFDRVPVPRRHIRASELKSHKLSSNRSGHVVDVDLFGPVRPGGGHSWLPPHRVPGLFDRARPVAPPGPSVLVPCPEDALVMIAEKTLRKGEFTHRRVGDSLAVLAEAERIDVALLADVADSQHVAGPLRWLLEQAGERGARVDPALDRLHVPEWEQQMIGHMASAPGPRATRLRALHRRLWVLRYVRDAPDHGVALLEVLEGRFRKPGGDRSRSRNA